MKFDDIAARFDASFINSVPHEIKIDWLSRLEAQLYDQLAKYYRVPDTKKGEYIALFPYDEIYLQYLSMKCAERNGDTVRFNNASAAFSAAFDALADYYNRNFESTKNTRYEHVLDLF